MNKVAKIFSYIAFVFAFCFLAIGYAAVQDTLTVSGTVSIDAIEPTAYAVYSAGDNSLEFFYGYPPAVGSISPRNKTVTAVYNNNIDTTPYLCYSDENRDDAFSSAKSVLPEWKEHASTTKSVYFDETFKAVTPVSTSGWFYNFTEVETFDFAGLDTTNVTDMSYMFWGCSTVQALDLSSFNTANVTDMHGMFRVCKNLTTLTMSGFNTSNVTDMSRMFAACEKITDLNVSSFDTSSVTNMHHMFAVCDKLESLDLSNFNTSNVTNMSYMFSTNANSPKLASVILSSFDTSNVTLMNHMFNGCRSLTELDLTSFNVDAVKDFQYMFSNCKALKTIKVASTWRVGSNAITTSMFNACSNLVGRNTRDATITSWDGDHINGTRAIIHNLNGQPGYLTGTLPEEDTTNENCFVVYGEARDADGNSLGKGLYFYDRVFTLEGATQIYLDKNSTSGPYQIIEETYDLSGTSWREYASDIKVVNIVDEIFPTSTAYWFSGFESCEIFEGLENLKTTYATSMAYMFNNCKKLNDSDLSALTIDTANATSVRYMFYGCTNLTNSDGNTFKFTNSKVDTDGDGEVDNPDAEINLTDLHSMFRGCGKLKQLNLSGLRIDTANVNLAHMFHACEVITTIAFSDWEILGFKSLPTNGGNKPQYGTAYMFANCHDLTEVDISFIKCKSVSAIEMFSNCYDITTIYADVGFAYESGGNVSNAISMFAQCKNLVGGNGTSVASTWAKEGDTYLNSIHARIDGHDGFGGYFTIKDHNQIRHASVTVSVDENAYFTWNNSEENNHGFIPAGQHAFFANPNTTRVNELKLTPTGASMPNTLTVTIGNGDTTTLTTTLTLNGESLANKMKYEQKTIDNETVYVLTIPGNLLQTNGSVITIGVVGN